MHDSRPRKAQFVVAQLYRHLLPPILGHLLPLFWDICSPLFRTFALRTFALGHLLPPILGHLLSVTKADLDSASMDDLKKICQQQYFDKWYSLGGEMFFLQPEVILRDLQINELTISVSDMKGKFINHTLKKVSEYENKFSATSRSTSSPSLSVT